MAARVAGVPRPRSRIASSSSRLSSERPADSMAVRSVASVNRRGGSVSLWRTSTFFAARFCPSWSPGGSARSESAGPLRSAGRPRSRSSAFHPSCVTTVPVERNRSTEAGESPSPGLATSVTTCVTRVLWSWCHAMSSRRQTRS